MQHHEQFDPWNIIGCRENEVWYENGRRRGWILLNTLRDLVLESRDWNRNNSSLLPRFPLFLITSVTDRERKIYVELNFVFCICIALMKYAEIRQLIDPACLRCSHQCTDSLFQHNQHAFCRVAMLRSKRSSNGSIFWLVWWHIYKHNLRLRRMIKILQLWFLSLVERSSKPTFSLHVISVPFDNVLFININFFQSTNVI